MTLTEKMVLNKKLKMEIPYANASNNDGEGKRKLICRLRIPPKDNSSVTGSDDRPLACRASHSFLDSGVQQQLNANSQSALISRKRKSDVDDIMRPNNKSTDPYQKHVSKKSEKVACISSLDQLDNQNIKGPVSLDASRRKQCAVILRKLMSHKFGWVFNQPVDPVRLNIPDYFQIIKAPMDLGTINKKLESKKYVNASQFAEDVRLTFANAMQYNPPSNDVHIMAKQLSNIFSTSWKVLEAKWSEEMQTWQGRQGEKKSNIKTVVPKSAAFRESHSKQPLAYSEQRRRKDADGRMPEIHLQKDVDNQRSWDRSHASLEATSHVLSGTQESGDGDTGPEGNSGEINFQPCPSPSPAISNLGVSEPFAVEELSPSKALRAAILKKRFADTILKAQQKKLNTGEKGDPEKIKREKERLEKMQQKERLRIEAEMKAAETALKAKEAELKMQREKEREAARLALQQMEKTVVIDENYGLLRDLQSFGYAEPTDKLLVEIGLDFNDGYPSPGSLGNPLERLGLFMKDDILEEDDDGDITPSSVCTDVEDGEFVSA